MRACFFDENSSSRFPFFEQIGNALARYGDLRRNTCGLCKKKRFCIDKYELSCYNVPYNNKHRKGCPNMKKLLLCIFSIALLLTLVSCAEEDPCENGHTITTRTVEPTCSYDGALVEYCAVCYMEFARTPIEKLAHTPAEEWQITVAPTCSSNGLQEKQCTVCNTVLDTLTLDMLPHTPADWELITEHTCTSDGTKVQYCMECGEIAGTETIPADHDVIELDAVAPTCANTGLTKGSKCSVCNEVFVSQVEIEKLDHNYQKVDAVAPSCSAYGYMEGSQCTACGAWEFDRVRIDKLSHTVVKDPAREPTCTQTGLLEGAHCSVCRETVIPQKTISAYGHDFSIFDNTCERCPEKEYPEIQSRNEALEYKGLYNAVMYLDNCMSVENTNEYWTMTLSSDTTYLRLVGTAGVDYNLRVRIESDHESDIRIDLVNVSLKTNAEGAVIDSASSADLHIGLYGTSCAISGRKGSDGHNASIIELAYNGKKGGNGFAAISTAGELTITMAADSASIVGGNGGDGGDGMNAASPLQDGGDGGNGGNGAYAIQASSVTVKGAEGHSSRDLILKGGDGGNGGKGGEGFLWGDNGKNGTPGSSHSATSVSVTYN